MSNGNAFGKETLLGNVLAAAQAHRHIPDTRVLIATLGAYAANLLDGEPVWLVLVAPPSTGKTAALDMLRRLPQVHEVSTISSEGALLSGTKKEECATGATGGLLRQIGDGNTGVLLFKDLTTTLSLRPDRLKELLGALREVYDGRYRRVLGVDGGKNLEWHGKAGLIAASTNAIDKHHRAMATMGERFVLYRLPDDDPRAAGLAALSSAGSQHEPLEAIANATDELFKSIDWNGERTRLTDAENCRIVDLATYVVRARSAVERDGRSREIVATLGVEGSPRLAQVLAQLLRGVRVIGATEEVAWSTVEKVAIDCIPAERWKVIKALSDGATHDVSTMARDLRRSPTTVRRTLEDLEGYDLACRNSADDCLADAWVESAFSRELRSAAFPCADVSGTEAA